MDDVQSGSEKSQALNRDASVVSSPVDIVRLLLVDDHAILREGLRALLELEPDLKVVGEAGSCEEALQKIVESRPDVVLTDIGMPGRSGLSLVPDIRNLGTGIRVVLLTAHASEEYIRAALDARADGYVLKDSGQAELIRAIRTVARGQPFMCKAVSDSVLARYMGLTGDGAGAPSSIHQVTDREKQVLSRIALGHSNKSVARELKLSVKTVEKHRANMMRKLNLHNAADIARYALNSGLVG